jgi:hypothetical protein
MYKLLIIITFFSLIYCKGKKSNAEVVELLSSRFGEISIIKKLSPNSKSIYFKDKLIFINDENSEFEYFKSFQFENEDVLLFISENKKSEPCPVDFFIITLNNNSEVNRINNFGNCSDRLDFTEYPNKLSIDFDPYKDKSSITVNYENGKIEVTETKLSKK